MLLACGTCGVEGILSLRSTGREVSSLNVSSRIVGTGKLPGIANGDDPRESLV